MSNVWHFGGVPSSNQSGLSFKIRKRKKFVCNCFVKSHHVRNFVRNFSNFMKFLMELWLFRFEIIFINYLQFTLLFFTPLFPRLRILVEEKSIYQRDVSISTPSRSGSDPPARFLQFSSKDEQCLLDFVAHRRSFGEGLIWFCCVKLKSFKFNGNNALSVTDRVERKNYSFSAEIAPFLHVSNWILKKILKRLRCFYRKT